MSKFKAVRALHREYYTNPDLEESGTWFPIGPDGVPGAARIPVRSAGARGPKTLRRQQVSRWQREYFNKEKSVPDAELLEDNLDYAATLVAGWENFRDDDGNAIACTGENVRELFTEYPHLLGDVIEHAQDRKRYGEQAEREMGKTSAASSGAA